MIRSCFITRICALPPNWLTGQGKGIIGISSGNHFTDKISRFSTAFVAFICLTASLLLAGCSSSNTSSNDFPYFRTIAQGRAAALQAMTDTGSSSISLAFVDKGRVIWAESFGLADKENSITATPDTLYCIGSTSKMFAAVATMLLVERWGVSLDEPLTTYIKSFTMASPEYRQITVRMLLNHSTGFPGSSSLNAETIGSPFTTYAATVLASLANQKLKHQPGYLSVYSNDGFTMVENLVSAVTGKSYAEFVRNEILDPLGMTKSIYPSGAIPPGTYAKTYASGVSQPQQFVNSYGSGGLYSTASDMARFAMMILNQGVYGSTRLLADASVGEMGKDQTAPFNPMPCDAFRYGLGWDSVTQPGLKAVGLSAWQKGGDATNYGSSLIVSSGAGLAVFVVGASGLSSTTAGALAEEILLLALAERGTIASMPQKLASSPSPTQPLTPQDQADLVGYYENNEGAIHVSFDADSLGIIDKWSTSGWTTTFGNLKLRNDGWYSSDENPLTAVTTITAGGRRYLAIRYVGGYGHYTNQLLYAQQLPAITAIPTDWQTRVGNTWLLANELSYGAEFSQTEDPRLTITTVSGMPAGYLMGTNLGVVDTGDPDRLNGMILLIPTLFGRDLTDIVVERHGSGQWLRCGSLFFRPLADVPVLGTGVTVVTIGSEGYTQWLKLPSSGFVTVTGASAWKLYDADFKLQTSIDGNGAAGLPGTGSESYLVAFGQANTMIQLNVTP